MGRIILTGYNIRNATASKDWVSVFAKKNLTIKLRSTGRDKLVYF